MRHPNIIQLYEIIETPKQLYLIMEYAAHGELFDYIVLHKRVDESVALKLFRQIVSGMAYLHSQNIIHRDLKPENLLLDSNDNIKIVDFGLSNKAPNNSLLKTACGSPCYAPPEMLLGKKYKGPPADIWSCGVVLYALLCGHLPFDDPSTTKLYDKITTADFTVSPHISKLAKDLISKMLRVDPSSRCTIEDIKKHVWFMGGEKGVYKLEPGITEISVNESTIENMKQSNIIADVNKTAEYIKANRHNCATTTYYLLLNGGSLKSDKVDGVKDLDETFLFEETDFYKAKMYPHKKNTTSVLVKSKTTRKDSSAKACIRKSTAFKDYNRNEVKYKKQRSVKARNIVTHRNVSSIVASTSQAITTNLEVSHNTTLNNASPSNLKFMNLTMTESSTVNTIIHTGPSSTTNRAVSKSFKESQAAGIMEKLNSNKTPKIGIPKEFKLKFADTEVRAKTTFKKYEKVKAELKCNFCYYLVAILMIKKEKQKVAVEGEKLKEAKSVYSNMINKIIEEPLIENTRLSPDFKASSKHYTQQ
jgi:5'-AMP-activated protein kinase catalytic alpha subunit